MPLNTQRPVFLCHCRQAAVAGQIPGVMAAKGSVANLRKKLLSRLSASDDRRSSPTSDAARWNDVTGQADRSTTTKTKDWPLHRQAKNRDRQQSQNCVGSGRYQNNIVAADCTANVSPPPPAGDVTDNTGQQSSAPVDLVASCSTPAHNLHSTAADSPVVSDVIASCPQQLHNHGLWL